MKILIQDKGATIKIFYDGKPEHIVKAQVRTIKMIRQNIVELNLGLGKLEMVYIPFPLVTNPICANPEALMDAIAAMLSIEKIIDPTGERDPDENPPVVGI